MPDMLEVILRNKQYLREGIRLRDTSKDFMDGEIGVIIAGEGDYVGEQSFEKLNDASITIPTLPYLAAMVMHDTSDRADVGATDGVTIIRAPAHPIWTKMYKAPDSGDYAIGDPLGISWDKSRPREVGSLADTTVYGVLCPAGEQKYEGNNAWMYAVVVVPPTATTGFMLVEFQMMPSSYDAGT